MAMHNAWHLPPRQILAFLFTSKTRVLHDDWDVADQIMARSALALHLLSLLPAAVPVIVISLFDVDHPAMFPGLVYNGLIIVKQKKSVTETKVDLKGGIWVLAFYPHSSFIRANKGGLHRGLSSRLGLLSHATCMEQPAIHMQMQPRQDLGFS